VISGAAANYVEAAAHFARASELAREIEGVLPGATKADLEAHSDTIVPKLYDLSHQAFEGKHLLENAPPDMLMALGHGYGAAVEAIKAWPDPKVDRCFKFVHDASAIAHVAATYTTRRAATERLAQLLAVDDYPLGDDLREVSALIGEEVPEAIRVATPETQWARSFRDDALYGTVRDSNRASIDILRSKPLPVTRDDAVELARRIVNAPTDQFHGDVEYLNWLVRRAPSDILVDPETLAKLAPPARRPVIASLLLTGNWDKKMRERIVAALERGIIDEQTATREFRRIVKRESLSEVDHALLESISIMYPGVRAGDSLATLEHWVRLKGSDGIALPPIRQQLQALAVELEGMPADAIAAAASERIARNIARIDKTYQAGPDEPKGYANFPDFAEVSEALADVKLLRSLRAPQMHEGKLSW
jgi:hypothetical protein